MQNMKVENFENRDLKCANEVAEMARLGKFDTEFLLYGSAVQELDGEIYYYVTANQNKLYQIMQKARMKELYFMPAVQFMRRMKVPSGMKEELLVKNKYELLQKMKCQYETFIPCMQPFFQTEPNDEAFPLLEYFRKEIDGYYDDTKLQLFWGLVQHSYEAKILTAGRYQELKRWYAKVRHQMADDPTYADNINRIFYGFVYETIEGERQFVFDAQYVDVINKRNEKIMQDYVVAPILKRKYAFKQFNEIGNVRERFKNWLLGTQTIDYFEFVRKLYGMNGVIDKNSLSTLMANENGKEYTLAAIKYYASIWNSQNNV